MTLADIATTVEQINKSINERKAKLAPDIKRLRQMRQQYAVGTGPTARVRRSPWHAQRCTAAAVLCAMIGVLRSSDSPLSMQCPLLMQPAAQIGCLLCPWSCRRVLLLFELLRALPNILHFCFR